MKKETDDELTFLDNAIRADILVICIPQADIHWRSFEFIFQSSIQHKDIDHMPFTTSRKTSVDSDTYQHSPGTLKDAAGIIIGVATARIHKFRR